MSEIMHIEVIHLGEADTGSLSCGAKDINSPKNWTWIPERVTCKKCLAIYRCRVGSKGDGE